MSKVNTTFRPSHGGLYFDNNRGNAMQLSVESNDQLPIEVTSDEAVCIHNALNEALGLVDDAEFALRMDGSTEEIRRLLADW